MKLNHVLNFYNCQLNQGLKNKQCSRNIIRGFTMKSVIKLIFLAITCSLFQVANAADPVTINITGNIIASPCEISNDSTTINIDLGQNLKAIDGKNEGSSVSPQITSQIKLINCPTSTTKVTATFHGTPADKLPDFLYKNDGTAQNVAVVLQCSSTCGLGNNKTYAVPVDQNHEATFPIQTYAYSLGNTTAGTISTVVTVSFVYN